jgi:hypothetical protein
LERPRQAAQFWTAITTIGDQERDEGAHAYRVSAIRDCPALTSAFHQARTRKDGNVSGKRVVRTANGLGKSGCGKPRRFLSHQQPEYCQSGRLAQRSEGRERVRRRHGSAAEARADMADHGQ